MIRKIYILPRLQLQEVLNICNLAKIYVYNPDDNYLPMRNICIYCKYAVYVGRELTKIPSGIRTYSITPQDFELYEKNVKEYVGRQQSPCVSLIGKHVSSSLIKAQSINL